MFLFACFFCPALDRQEEGTFKGGRRKEEGGDRDYTLVVRPGWGGGIRALAWIESGLEGEIGEQGEVIGGGGREDPGADGFEGAVVDEPEVIDAPAGVT